MSLPTIELAYGTATEVARSNPQVFDPAAAILKQQDGLLKSVDFRVPSGFGTDVTQSSCRLYHGIQHEDQKTVYAVVGEYDAQRDLLWMLKLLHLSLGVY